MPMRKREEKKIGRISIHFISSNSTVGPPTHERIAFFSLLFSSVPRIITQEERKCKEKQNN
jgi:hypothetical protein